MANSRKNDSWDNSNEVYSPSQVEATLRALGIDVVNETANDFISMCPFHDNTEDPAFSTSRTYGYSLCFNPACGVGDRKEDGRLTLEKLVMRLKGKNKMEAKRFIKMRVDDTPFEEMFDSIDIDNMTVQEFPAEAIAVMHERFMNTDAAKNYMKGRGFDKETMEFFKVGFTPAATGWDVPVYRPFDMVVVPAYTHKGQPVGLVGRSIEGKQFKNYGPGDKGKGFHKSEIVWNLNNAKQSETIVLTEATFDSMRVHQAGYPNVGALLGGSLSKTQSQLLRRHFKNVIIMTDNETGNDVIYPKHCRKCLDAGHVMCIGHQPGRELGMRIADELAGMRVSWAVYDDRNVYANGVKDAAGMTDREISVCLRNAISHFEYLDWVA